MKIIPLGISSGRPTLHRGLSSVAVVLDQVLVLLDCGEGTQWQLARAGLRPTSKLEAVFLTHLHGDHVTGLPGLLGTMTMENREAPLSIFGPPGIREYLEMTRRLAIVRPPYELRIEEVSAPGEVHRGTGYRVRAEELVHRVRAFGYRLEEDERPGRFDADKAAELGIDGPLRGRLIRGESVKTREGREVKPADVVGPPRRGLRIAYCTDTVPCEASSRLGEEADLMIHECTYEASHTEEAVARGHSTTVGAASVAKQARARRVLLTHFSPRYEDLTPLLAEAQAIYPPCELAEELKAIELVPPG
jgi:ribonuclease Z